MRRRDLILAGFALELAPVALALEGATLKGLTRGKPVTNARVVLKTPSLAENGNSVALTVDVESPMTGADHVRSIHIFAPENPVANVAIFRFTPASGRARAATRIRLSDTQTITALAEMNDGALYAGSAKTIVTLAACIEPLL